MKQYYTHQEIINKTGLKPFNIDYLVRNRIIPCITKGKGITRLFPIEALEIIIARQKKINPESK